MQKFEISAPDLYAISKAAFFRLIPYCEVNLVQGYAQMFFSVDKVAKEQNKTKRIEIMSLILVFCECDQQTRVGDWLNSYFSANMQKELFDCTVFYDGLAGYQFVPGKSLERAISKNKRKG